MPCPLILHQVALFLLAVVGSQVSDQVVRVDSVSPLQLNANELMTLFCLDTG